MTNWKDDPEMVKLIEDIAYEQWQQNKDNPYAAIGYANVIHALHGKKKDTTPKWIRTIKRILGMSRQ